MHYPKEAVDTPYDTESVDSEECGEVDEETKSVDLDYDFKFDLHNDR